MKIESRFVAPSDEIINTIKTTFEQLMPRPSDVSEADYTEAIETMVDNWYDLSAPLDDFIWTYDEKVNPQHLPVPTTPAETEQDLERQRALGIAVYNALNDKNYQFEFDESILIEFIKRRFNEKIIVATKIKNEFKDKFTRDKICDRIDEECSRVLAGAYLYRLI